MVFPFKISKPVEYFKNLKIQYKLIAIFLVLLIIPFSVLGLLSYYKSSSVILQDVTENSRQIVKQVSDKIDYNMKEIDKNTLLFVWSSQTQAILSSLYSQETLYKRRANQMELESAIQTFLNTRLEIESVYIYREDGDEFFIDDSTYNKDIRKRIIMKRTEIITEAENLKGRNNWITINKDKDLITGTRIIYDTINLNKLGVLIINIQEKYLRNLYNEAKLSPNSFFIIKNKAGEIISTNSKLNDDEINEVISNAKTESKSIKDIKTSVTGNGKFFIVGQTSEFTGWEVLGVIPADELLGGIKQIGSWILLTGIVCAVIATLLLLFFSSYILQPIRGLMKLMKKVEQEDFSVKAEPMSKDELGELTVVFNKMIEKIRYLIEEVYKQQIIKTEAEFKFLQAQINPHFLYNTLDSINWIAKINGVEDISRMVVALGQLMRISIAKGKGIITLEKELDYINNYLIIQSMRYRDKFKVDINIDDNVKKCVVPKLMLQPIVENALVHGIEKKLGKGNIIVKAQARANALYINVIDDGMGMDNVQIEEVLQIEGIDNVENEDGEHTRVGISNVNRRIKMMYGNGYGVSIESEVGKGTDVQICIPITFEDGGKISD